MNGHRHTTNGGSLPFRPPTVDQALQHSPLTSINPFSATTIPFPSAAPPGSSTILTNPEQRASGQQVLDSLNSEASNQATSVRLQRTLRDLRELLNVDVNYDFKGAPTIPTPPPDSPGVAATSNGSLRPLEEPRLSSFAKMVLANTNVAHRYPTPDSPLGPKARHSSTGRPLPSPDTPNEQPVARNATALSQNVNLRLPSSNAPTPKKSPQVVIPGLPPSNRDDFQKITYIEESPSKKGPRVVVPGLPPSSNREDFQKIAYIEESPSKKRKRPEADEYALAMTSNERQQADRKSQEFRNLLDGIFEGDDIYQTDPSGPLSPEVAKYLTVKDVEYGEALVLKPDTQNSLLSHLQPVIDARRFHTFPVEDVIRLQKLCKSRVDAIDRISLIIGSTWEDGDLEGWLSGVQDVQYGLAAAKIVLKTMTAGREEKKIYSEGMIGTIVNALKHTLEALIPIVQSRPNSTVFEVSSGNKQEVSKLLQMSGKTLKMLGDLLTNVEVAESAITSIEDLSTRLVFVENATAEKDSALGIKKFENFRPVAMDVLAKIFARYEDRRQATLSDILMSLGKLSVDRRGARQYKMVDGKAIQLVSALLMRLVQTSAALSISQQNDTKTLSYQADKDDDDEEEDSSDDSDDDIPAKRKPTNKAHNMSSLGLAEITQDLHKSTQAATSYVVNFMVERASNSTKSGDEPFRNLLDIFTEDFLSVLGSPEWPAAPTFLHALLLRMLRICTDPKSLVNAKTMALDLMGIMGSGIIDLQGRMKRDADKLDRKQSMLSAHLAQLAEQLSEQFSDQLARNMKGNSSNVDKSVLNAHKPDFLDFEGPYRVVLEYLRQISRDDDLRSAQGCHITGWAWELCEVMKKQEDDEENPALVTLHGHLKSMILDPKWLSAEYTFESVSQDQARLAAVIIALQTPFGQMLQSIVNWLLHSMNSTQGRIRGKSVKNIELLLDKNPQMLNHLIVQRLLVLTKDNIQIVRDYSLQLLDKCIGWDPAIESQCLEYIISRANDSASSIKKKAMVILRNIYLRSEVEHMKSLIADALLVRIQDTEEDVAKTACTHFESIWIAPFYNVATTQGVKLKEALKGQVSLIVRTVQRRRQHQKPGLHAVPTLKGLLQRILTNDPKSAEANTRVCKSMVAELFEGMIGDDVLPGKPPQVSIVETLAVFAQASPKLFTVEQLVSLQTFTKNIKTTDDLQILWSVMIILRHVLPLHTTYPDNFLSDVTGALYENLRLMRNQELNECAQCVSITDGLLNENGRRFYNLVLASIRDLLKPNQGVEKLITLRLAILGYFGKYCSLEHRVEEMKGKFPGTKFRSVAELIINTMLPYSRQQYPKGVQRQALESVAMICQSFPKEYAREDVNEAFKLVFRNDDVSLKSSLLDQFLSVFAQEEKRSEVSADNSAHKGSGKAPEGFSNSLVANESDGVPNRLATNFLGSAIEIALGSINDTALKATQFIASSNRQGLIIPQDCLPTLVALETSPDINISAAALQEHHNLWKKSTGMEKEHLKGVSLAFDYQRDVVKDTRGANVQPFSAKLRNCYDVLRNGEFKQRKKFITNMVDKLKFQPQTLDTSGDQPTPLHYARFCLENLAFFDYARQDEILQVISSMEKLVSATGISVAHVIETDILGIRLDAETSRQEERAPLPASAPTPNIGYGAGTPTAFLNDGTILSNGDASVPTGSDTPAKAIDEVQLRHLTVASMILTMMWETRTFLRNLWGLKRQRDGKPAAKGPLKNFNAQPNKAPGITGDKYWQRISDIMSAIDNTDTMLAQCKAFAELLSVDDELKVGEEEDEEAQLLKAAEGYDTPSADEDTGSIPPSSGRNRKRKGSMPATGTPKKRKVGAGKARVRARKSRGGSGSTPDADADGELF